MFDFTHVLKQNISPNESNNQQKNLDARSDDVIAHFLSQIFLFV